MAVGGRVVGRGELAAVQASLSVGVEEVGSA